MKKRFLFLTLSCLASMAAGFLTALLLAGCSTVTPDGPYAGDDFLYKTDLAIVVSYDVLNNFVTWEYENRVALSATPAIRQAADTIRRDAKAWVSSAMALRDAYAATPNTDTKSALQKALAVLQASVTEATRYMSANLASQ